MKEVLENIWDWIDLYAWTLVAIVFIILSIVVIVCEISITINQKKFYKKQMEKHNQEEHDNLAQIVEAQRLYAQSKDKKVCKKCANCRYYASKRLNPTGKVYKCNYCDYYEGNIVRNVNLFTSCKHFKEKE